MLHRPRGKLSRAEVRVDLPWGKLNLPRDKLSRAEVRVNMPRGIFNLPWGKLSRAKVRVNLSWGIFNLYQGRLTLSQGIFDLQRVRFDPERGSGLISTVGLRPEVPDRRRHEEIGVGTDQINTVGDRHDQGW